jgi:hypothetical protein
VGRSIQRMTLAASQEMGLMSKLRRENENLRKEKCPLKVEAGDSCADVKP